jgi:carbon starvation protein CstA
MVSIPLFIAGFIMSQLEFATIWKYLGLSNQILAVVVLWTAAMYLAINKKNHLILSIPATFLTAVCITYLMVAPFKNGGLSLPIDLGYPIGIASAILALSIFLIAVRRKVFKVKYSAY